jgi:hypothetical protein
MGPNLLSGPALAKGYVFARTSWEFVSMVYVSLDFRAAEMREMYSSGSLRA